MNGRAWRTVGLVAVTALCGLRAEAAQWWNPVSWFRKAPTVVLVTGNYTRPRLLAELAQMRTGHPIVLVTPPVQGEVVYLMPARALAVAGTKAAFAETVAALQPAQVIFLGDPEHMPPAYIEAATAAGLNAIVLDRADWNGNAALLGALLKSDWIPRRYAELLPILEEPVRTAPALPAAPAPAVAAPAAVPAAAPDLSGWCAPAPAAPAPVASGGLNLVPPDIKQ